MKVFGLLAASASAGFIDHPLSTEFNEWKLNYGKSYGSEQENLQKFENWMESRKFVLEHNIKYLMNESSFSVELNHLADLTDAEWAEMNTLRSGAAKDYSKAPPKTMCTPAPEAAGQDNPGDVDWRKQGYVNPIKNQGQCGSCWAFSTVGSMEGAHFKKTGKLVSLSEQNLVDCAQKEGNHGCKGGLMDFGFQYIKDAGGIDTEASYPYTAKDGTCKFNKDNIGATIDSCFDIKQFDEAQLETAAATIGPISIGMDAHLISFRLYKSGIYHDKMCSSIRLDHGVLVVGYHNVSAEEAELEGNKKNYWIVRNSWGESWGQEGYFWLAKDHKNACGVATSASYPVAAS